MCVQCLICICILLVSLWNAQKQKIHTSTKLNSSRICVWRKENELDLGSEQARITSKQKARRQGRIRRKVKYLFMSLKGLVEEAIYPSAPAWQSERPPVWNAALETHPPKRIMGYLFKAITMMNETVKFKQKFFFVFFLVLFCMDWTKAVFLNLIYYQLKVFLSFFPI